MIESISIADVATYASAPETLAGLAKFNFLFGSNGTGKTTVSRLIADENDYAHDDLYVSIDDSMVEIYLKVFRGIFVKARHIEHYKMMMGNAYVEEPTAIMAPVAVPLPSSSP